MPVPPTPVAQIKGSAVREFALWYEAHHGRAYVAGVVRRLPPEIADQIWPERHALGLVATEWYRSEVVHAILDAVSEGRTDAEMAALLVDASDLTVRRLSRGLYQFLFRMVASPGLYAKHVQRAWRTLHSTGERTIYLSEGMADSVTSSWPGHHRWLCFLTNETMRRVFEAMGCRDVSLERINCVSDGDARCRCVLRYVEPR